MVSGQVGRVGVGCGRMKQSKQNRHQCLYPSQSVPSLMETRAEVSWREKGKELAKARLQPCSVLVASGKVCRGRYAEFTAAILFILIRLPREAESKSRHLGQGNPLNT